MSFTNYGTLKTAIGAQHARADVVAGDYDNYCQLAEARINRVLAQLGAGELKSTAITASTEATDLPVDFNGMRSLSIEGASRTTPLQYYPPERIYQEYGALSTGQPRAYTILGKDGASDVMQVNLRPLPDGVYTLRAIYYRKVATLVGLDSNTNWMLSNNPDIYLHAMLIELAIKQQDTNLAQVHMTALDAAFGDLKSLDRLRRWGGSALRMRPNVLLMKGN